MGSCNRPCCTAVVINGCILFPGSFKYQASTLKPLIFSDLNHIDKKPIPGYPTKDATHGANGLHHLPKPLLPGICFFSGRRNNNARLLAPSGVSASRGNIHNCVKCRNRGWPEGRPVTAHNALVFPPLSDQTSSVGFSLGFKPRRPLSLTDNENRARVC